jgi:hypothetical protein
MKITEAHVEAVERDAEEAKRLQVECEQKAASFLVTAKRNSFIGRLLHDDYMTEHRHWLNKATPHARQAARLAEVAAHLRKELKPHD